MNFKELNEQALIDACKQNIRLAQKQLYERYYVEMMRVCQRYVNHADDAVEVLNQGFFNAFSHLNKFDSSKGSLKKWLVSIMVNAAIDSYRKNKKLSMNVELTEVDSGNLMNSSLDNLSADEILKFVQELSPQYRTVFNLAAIEGFSHIEIGKILGISEGTSKSNYARARIKLQSMINYANQFNTLKKVK